MLSPRSSLLVLGDGRNNYRNPETDLLEHMVNASRHAHWLNPEPKHLWGSGDSAVPRYEDVITMHECRSAKQLASGDRRPAARSNSPRNANSSIEEVREEPCWNSVSR